MVCVGGDICLPDSSVDVWLNEDRRADSQVFAPSYLIGMFRVPHTRGKAEVGNPVHTEMD